jgi:hypothetical protein
MINKMETTVTEKVIHVNSVYSNPYIECKPLFTFCFDQIPSVTYTLDVDGERAFAAFKQKYAEQIASLHDYNEYSKKGEFRLIQSVAVLKNECIVEFRNNYCEFYYKAGLEDFVLEMTKFAKQFKERQKRKPLEINLVVRDSGYMELRSMEIKRISLDLGLFYEDSFKEVDATIRKRLGRKNDKGIVLLHGLPGTGKTTYLRYLIGKVKKRILFMSNNLASSLVDPEFIDLLISNPNSVVIVEDAENIMMDRRANSNSPVSNLLNISDGLLADFLNIQLVCTFNSPLVMVDPALMRKGRLIARYEFGKLSVPKAQRLSNHFGFDKVITRPMTLAEITNPNDMEERTIEVIGFRRQNACLQ